jgi:hypothetical protein
MPQLDTVAYYSVYNFLYFFFFVLIILCSRYIMPVITRNIYIENRIINVYTSAQCGRVVVYIIGRKVIDNLFTVFNGCSSLYILKVLHITFGRVMNRCFVFCKMSYEYVANFLCYISVAFVLV